MPVFMISAGWKAIGQAMFIAAGLIALAMHEKEAGWLLLGTACGSVVPIAEREKAKLPRASAKDKE